MTSEIKKEIKENGFSIITIHDPNKVETKVQVKKKINKTSDFEWSFFYSYSHIEESVALIKCYEYVKGTK